MPKMTTFPRYYGPLQKSEEMQGVYRARVESIDDPYSIGRVRIRIPMLHGVSQGSRNYIESEGLPWASPCFAGAGADYGSYLVPEVGEYVFVVFEGGNTSKPVYLGSSYGTMGKTGKQFGTTEKRGGNGTVTSVAGQNEVPSDALEKGKTSKKIVYRSLKGSSFEILDATGEESIIVKDPLGQTLTLSSNLSSGTNYRRIRAGNNLEGISTGASIALKGVYGQQVVINSEVNGDSEVSLSNKGVYVTTKATSSGKEIELTIGDTTLKLSDSDGNKTVRLNNNSAVIELKNNSDISITKGSCSVNLQGSNVILNGSSETLVI